MAFARRRSIDGRGWTEGFFELGQDFGPYLKGLFTDARTDGGDERAGGFTGEFNDPSDGGREDFGDDAAPSGVNGGDGLTVGTGNQNGNTIGGSNGNRSAAVATDDRVGACGHVKWSICLHIDYVATVDLMNAQRPIGFAFDAG